jgi:hypothetical protein
LLKKLQALIQAERKPESKAIMELRHKFDLNLLLNQTNMAQVILLSSKKSTDKYQVIKELIKSIYKHKGRWIQEDNR